MDIALAWMVLLTILLEATVSLVYGKMGFMRILIPLLMLFIGDFILLYSKFVVGDDFLAFILYVPAATLLLIALIWLLVLLSIIVVKKESKKKGFAILLSFIITIVIIALDGHTQIDKFKIYQSDYFAVSNAIFQAYDEGKIKVGQSFQSPPRSSMDLEDLKKIFPAKVIKQMRILNRSAGVADYVIADKDIIYFSFGAGLQSIDGIAILRSGTSIDMNNRARTYYQSINYEYISDDVYYFTGGL